MNFLLRFLIVPDMSIEYVHQPFQLIINQSLTLSFLKSFKLLCLHLRRGSICAPGCPHQVVIFDAQGVLTLKPLLRAVLLCMGRARVGQRSCKQILHLMDDSLILYRGYFW
jgi:hypothetical protein